MPLGGLGLEVHKSGQDNFSMTWGLFLRCSRSFCIPGLKESDVSDHRLLSFSPEPSSELKLDCDPNQL